MAKKFESQKRYRCKFTGDYQPEANRNHTEEYFYGSVVKRWPCVGEAIDPLEVGETAVDSMGDTWERIA